MNCKPSKFIPPARSSSNVVVERPRSTPATGLRQPSPTPPPVPAKNGPVSRASNVVTGSFPSGPTPLKATRSFSQPFTTPGSSAPIHKNQVWDDLISLQDPSQTSSLPLQYQPSNFTPSQSALPSQIHAAPPNFHVSPNPFSTLQGSPMMPSSMPSMNNPAPFMHTYITPGGPSTITSPQTPFQQPYPGYPSPNMPNTIPAQMVGTPAAAPVPQQSYFAQSFGQPPQPALGHVQDPNFMYAPSPPHMVQQQYQPNTAQMVGTPSWPPSGAAPSFEVQQPMFPTNAAYGGWQNMHGNFQ